MKNAVLVVDYQFDFADPKGGLYVKDGEKIQKSINEFLEKVKGKAYIIASRDWHPKNHCSFVENGGQWNTHCVQNTDGAKLYFDPKHVNIIISKGEDANKEEYSCVITDSVKNRFNEFDNIFVLGLAKDFCVKYSLKDLNFFNNNIKLYLINDLSKSVFPKNDKDLLKEFEGQDIKVINRKEAEEIICQ